MNTPAKQGENWAICTKPGLCEFEADYIPGTDAETAEVAETIWRKWRHLFFMDVRVRRTTPAEDNGLKAGLKEPSEPRKNPMPGVLQIRSAETYHAIVKEVNSK